MKLEYCKQCGRMISKEEVDSGEAYVSAEESYCKTCALGKGLEVSVGTAKRRRRRTSGSGRSPAAGRRSSTSLVVLLLIVCVVAAAVTVAVVAMLKTGSSGPEEAAPAPAPGPPPTVEVRPETPPDAAPSPSPAPGPAGTPQLLSPDEIRAAARSEYEGLAARAKEFEEAGRLADAMSVYSEWPFKYRHTKLHDVVTGHRARLAAACREHLDGIGGRLTALAAEGKPGEARDALLAASLAVGVPAKDRIMRIVEAALRLGIDVRVVAGALPWNAGRGARLASRGTVVDVYFAARATERSVEVELPRDMTWDLSGHNTIEFVVSDGPADAEFIADVGTARAGGGSGICTLREEGVYTVQLDAMGVDLKRVKSIRLTLAQPDDREVKCTLKLLAITKK